MLSPAAKSGIFLPPVSHAPSQGIILAAFWVGIQWLLKGYSFSNSRTLRVLPLTFTWIGASAPLLAGATALLSVPLDSEIDFLIGSATVLGGWRFCLCSGVDLP